MGYSRVILVGLLCVYGFTGAPVTPGPDISDAEKTYNYLVKYGYLTPTEDDKQGADTDFGEFQQAIRNFQKIAGIKQTGFVDNQTLYYMSLPRCGNREDFEITGFGDIRRRKRFVLSRNGGKWNNTSLTYRIRSYPTSGLTRQQTDNTVSKAFRLWSSESNLQFTQVTGAADIEILFVKGDHGDGRPFDGPQGTIAHAFFPNFGGDAHFDDDENFTIEQQEGINLLFAVTHELGHSLGLAHTPDNEAVMAPFYKGYIPNLKLQPDDIRGIQYLYGKPVTPSNGPVVTRSTVGLRGESPANERTTTPGPVLPTSPQKDKHTCDIKKLDAIFTLRSDRIYIFSGAHYWRLDRYRADDGYPKLIKDHWFLPNDIDASLDFADNSGTVYFFKGEDYWKYTRHDPIMIGYPKKIGIDGFFGIPANISSAFLWSGNNRVYFTKGPKYYRLESFFTGDAHGVESYNVSYSYPKPLAVWRGLPDTVDAAVQLLSPNSPRITYFFTDKVYYRFNDTNFWVEEGYPKSTLLYWLGCNEGEKLQR